MIVTLSVLAVGGYAGLCLLVWAAQGTMLYFPDRQVRLAPSDLNLRYRDVEIPTEDGQRLHGWVIPGQPDAPWVLFCHGNAGNISHRLGQAVLFHRMGASLLLFDYRGYGRSTGSPDEAGLQRDARAAWRHLVDTEGAERIVLMGESLGGGVAVGLAEELEREGVRPAGLVTENTFTSVPDMAARLYPWLPVRSLCRHRYPSRERIARLGCPKLLLHAREDEIIPVEHGRALAEAAAEPKAFHEILGGHNTSPLERGPEYVRLLSDFLREVGLSAPPRG